MRALTAGLALLLASAVPAVVVPPVAAMPEPVPVVATPTPRPAPVPPPAPEPPRGPTPSSWDGGRAVAVAPRWWPTGYSHASSAWLTGWPKPVAFAPTRSGVLSGQVIAIDPGHNIGNGSHVSLINRTYWVGLTKTCNTTGTATNAGYPEATYAFDVAARLRRLLQAAGATVVLTRDRNSTSTYGPCVGARGAFAAQERARLMVSIHGDGGPATGRGFHVIVPSSYAGYTDDIAARSQVLGRALIAAMRTTLTPTTYLSSPLSVRKDQGTLNTSDVPTAIVETLNMRNASDAAIASSTSGRQKVAAAVYRGILRYLGH